VNSEALTCNTNRLRRIFFRVIGATIYDCAASDKLLTQLYARHRAHIGLAELKEPGMDRGLFLPRPNRTDSINIIIIIIVI